MIRSLEVKGLNNRLDGKFEFNEDLNIFTGANGTGKTTLLKLIWYFISGHFEQILSEIPFSFISIKTDPFSLTLDRQKPEELVMNFAFASGGGGHRIKIDPETRTIAPKNIDNVNKLEKQIAESSNGSLFFPSFRRIEGGFSMGVRSSVHSETSSEIRLLSSTTESLLAAISHISDEVSTDKHRFIFSVSTIDIAELLPQKYVDIYQEINRLQSQILANISKEMKSKPDRDIVSEIYQSDSLMDSIQKVEKETERLRQPISVLSDLIRMFLQYNAILVAEKLVLGGKNNDFDFGEDKGEIDITEISNVISSDRLSAGEKQMLSFLCYNAFYSDISIFIDEPELSLHVDWQRRLIPTLLEQGQKNQFFVATHSPFIYSKYPDKEFMLDEDRGES